VRIIVLGGAGIIGRAIARDLADDREVEEIVIADLDLDGARKTAAELKRPGITAVRSDVTDEAALVKLIEGAGAVINSVQYYFNLPVMRACLRAKTHYVDLGGLFHTTRKQLELDGDFKKAGILAVLGLGSCPGIANVQARALADRLDTVDSIRIYNGSTPDQGDSLAWAYSIQTIFDEIIKPPMVYRDGQFLETSALGEEELFRFKITFFGYSEKALRQLQFLAGLGLASDEPIEVRGAKVRPRDVLIEALKRAPQIERTKSLGFKDIVTEVRGTQAGKEVVGKVETTAWPHAEWGMSGGTLLVASPPAIVARWLASGKIGTAGVKPPEQAVDPAAFFKDLEARGARTSLSLAEPYPA
jgi:saccharopine dehydrogenase (NAD+, L-lysine-forming)